MRRRTALRVLALVVVIPIAFLVFEIATSFGAFLVLARNTPQLTWIGEAVPAPGIAQAELPTVGDPSQTGLILYPSVGVRHRGVLLVNGAEVPGGWRDATIQAFAKSLADLGLAVYVPDLPGFEQGALSMTSLQALDADIRWLAASDYVDGPVALVGVCVGASLGLVAAEDPSTASAVRSIVAIDPYADLADEVEAATTGEGPNLDGRTAPFDMVPWIRADLVRSIAGTLPSGASRATMLNQLAAAPEDDPLAPFRVPAPSNLAPIALAWWQVLGNRSAADFPRLYGALPADARAELSALSPVGGIRNLSVPVLIAAPVHDFAFPAGEATKLQQGNPAHVQLTRSSALDHVTPSLSPGVVVGYWQLWRFAAAGLNLLR